MWVTCMPLKKPYQIYQNFADLLNRRTQFNSFALEKLAKCSVMKELNSIQYPVKIECQAIGPVNCRGFAEVRIFFESKL